MAIRFHGPQDEILIEADAATYHEGELLKEGSASSRVAKTTAKGDTAIAVVVQTRKDPKTDTAEASSAGDKIRVFPLGTKAQVDVKSVISQAYTPGAAIYLDDTVDGQVTAAASTSRPIGHYPRNMAARTTASAGELIPCNLDVEPGAATV
jgi:hypothetical protein